MLIHVKKIAIYHNLNPGGGLNQIKNIVKILSNRGLIIDIYSHKNHKIIGSNQILHFPIDKPKNSITELFQSLYSLRVVQKRIAKAIISKNYDYIFIFPCHIVQSPHIIRYLPRKKSYYFFLEPKREFYEKTSFDYYTPKRIISRLIRYPIKIFDYINCRSSQNIISNSKFSQKRLKEIYNKKSMVIYPGLKPIKPTRILIKNRHNFLSLGLLSMLKGHHLSAKLVPKLEIYGEKSHENITKYLPKNIHINESVSDSSINNVYKKYTFFMANQINESFGLTTLEAAQNNCFIFGSNEGGTPEIIKNSFNGVLLPKNNIKLSKKIIDEYNKKDVITLIKTCIIDWDYTVDQILKLIEYE